MTNKEAIEFLKIIVSRYPSSLETSFNDECELIALNMAIKALEERPQGDLINREALKKKIDEVQYTQDFCIEHQIDYSISMQMLGMIIDNAPSVEVGYLTNCANCEKVEKIRAKRHIK